MKDSRFIGHVVGAADTAEEIVQFAVNVGHFPLDPALRLTQAGLQQSHLLA